MRIPASFALAYERQEAVLARVQELANTRMRVLCKQRHWLFDDRIKGHESVLAKLQLGEHQRLSEMTDLYAAMVVVPTRTELDVAAEAVMGLFASPIRKAARTSDAEWFPYDDIHVYAELGPLGPVAPTEVGGHRFEIQIRTGLQYAWWRATHDVLYKGEDHDWRLRRVAAQLRATLELVDGTLADLPSAALLLEQRSQAASSFTEIASWLELWPERRRPVDRIRFWQAVGVILDAAGVDPVAGRDALDTAVGMQLVSEVGITPVQAVLGALVEQFGLDVVTRLRQTGRYVLITEELETHCPTLARTTDADRVALT